MKLSQSLTDRTAKGVTYIFCQDTQVISYRKALCSSSKVNEELAKNMMDAYAKYLQRMENPYAPIRKQNLKDVPFLIDLVNDDSIACIMLESNQCPLIYIKLHPLASSSASSELIREIKSVYANYMVEMLKNKTV